MHDTKNTPVLILLWTFGLGFFKFGLFRSNIILIHLMLFKRNLRFDETPLYKFTQFSVGKFVWPVQSPGFSP